MAKERRREANPSGAQRQRAREGGMELAWLIGRDGAGTANSSKLQYSSPRCESMRRCEKVGVTRWSFAAIVVCVCGLCVRVASRLLHHLLSSSSRRRRRRCRCSRRLLVCDGRVDESEDLVHILDRIQQAQIAHLEARGQIVLTTTTETGRRETVSGFNCIQIKI